MRQWWHALGSDQRFEPKWWQRKAYIEGLRDAARIIDSTRFRYWHDGKANAIMVTRECIQNIHARSVKVAPELNQ